VRRGEGQGKTREIQYAVITLIRSGLHRVQKMDMVINDEIQKELQIGLYQTEDKKHVTVAGGYNILKEYKKKPSIIHYAQEEVLAAQDGKLMTEQYDLLYSKVRITDDDDDDDD
jgi:hypothetical protein